MTRIHCLMHVPFEGPGAIADWAAERGHELVEVRTWAQPLPDPADGVVVMGGPMGVHDAAPAWLAEERALLARAIAAGLPILGVCLGAQQLCLALGGSVAPGPVPEIGWFPIRCVADPMREPLAAALEEGATVLHWHGDACRMPPGARRLWATDACPVQGFAWGSHVLGLQFHLEIDRDGVDALIAHGGDDLTPRRTVQDPAALHAGADRFTPANRASLFALLDRWWGEAAAASPPGDVRR